MYPLLYKIWIQSFKVLAQKTIRYCGDGYGDRIQKTPGHNVREFFVIMGVL